MSDPITALAGASYDGGIARIAEAPLQGMITLRGDVAATAIKKAVKAVSGLSVPSAGAVHFEGEAAVCWMSPDELLLLCPYADVDAKLEQLQTALAKVHALAVNVSDARACFSVSGPHAREVLAKLCPVNLAPDRFGPGMFRRTRLAQVAAAVWMREEGIFQIVCFRSQAQYVFDVLTVAAQPGSAVAVWPIPQSEGLTPKD